MAAVCFNSFLDECNIMHSEHNEAGARSPSAGNDND